MAALESQAGDSSLRSRRSAAEGAVATPVLRLRGGASSRPGAEPRAHVTLAHGGGGGGRGSAGGFRRLEPDPVARVWARVSPSLLRPPLVFRSVAGAAAMAERGLEPSPAAVAALPPEVRAQLAELELELSEGDITQKGYEKKRSKLLSPYSPQTQETDSTGQKERNQTPAPMTAQTSAPSKYHRSRSGGARDERYRSGKKE
ncbi:uncharacterized protein LOC116890560 [Rattus rattus]|uniref:uncharacterized protein LOC116890560 n=1 Tax=Rattus rattus TaxID=10117 RepID=UPI0013F32731|nr:uncharacterized protein LOC116890560 [Rattus rattus]